jgi:UDP-N-acetylmuramate--alanine ligase
LDDNDKNSKNLLWQRQDVNYILVDNDNYIYNWEIKQFPKIEINIPWQHIVYDAKLVYILWILVWIDEKIILDTFKNYNWVWRRNEIIWQTKNNNIVISDYWHHPTEIKLTLTAIKDKYKDKQLLTVFQPHQFNRTIELLDNFVDSFSATDKLIIPNIYESRDTEKDKERMNTDIFVNAINHKDKSNWNWFENTLKLIEDFDKKNPNSAVIVLLGAGNIDDLRYKII